MLTRIWQKGNSPMWLMGMLISAATRENSVKDHTALWSCPQLGIYATVPKLYMYHHISCRGACNSQNRQFTRLSIITGIKKISFIIKKEWNSTICPRPNGNREYHIDCKKKAIKRQIMCLFCLYVRSSHKNKTKNNTKRNTF